MVGIRKTVLVVALLGFFGLGVQAQVVRGPYETNKAFDNTYIGIAAGVNSFVGNPLGLFQNDLGSFGHLGLAAEINFGKWWTPAVGMRLGYRGLWDKAAWDFEVSGIPKGERFGFHYVHGDFLWNIFNSIFGYERERFWNLNPYIQMGLLDVSKSINPADGANLEYAAGPGFLNEFRLSDRINATLDLNVLWSKCSAYSAHSGRYLFFPAATVGLQFKLNKTWWDRHTDVAPVIVPLPFTTDQYNALAERAAALEAENAGLRDKASALQSELDGYRSQLVNGQTYLYENGTFTAVDVKPGAPAAVFFNLDSYKLTAREQAHLEYFIDHVVDGNTLLTVSGYADKQTGNPKYNKRLSEQRARAVADFLVKGGAQEENIEIHAHGDVIQPFEGMEKNRVVTIELR